MKASVSSPNPQVVIFTGGHHTSALEVAKNLQLRGWKIVWFGHKFSMWGDKNPSAEYREVTQSGIDFVELKAGKLHHTYNPLKLIRIPYGFFQSALKIYELKRQYGKNLRGIVSFGGYLGVPVVFCGRIFGLPAISHEQTAAAGLANKFISRFAGKIALTWPGTAGVYPKNKTVVVGLPIRREIAAILKHPPARKKLIYITGGKQGSHTINKNVFAILNDLLADYSVIHQTGSSSLYNDFAAAVKLKESLPDNLREKYQVHEYVDAGQAANALSTAEVVISRSGAHTVYELGLYGTRSVLIPIPWSSGREQQKNAEILENNHQAIILEQDRLTPVSLAEAVKSASRLKPVPLKLPENATERMIHLIESEL